MTRLCIALSMGALLFVSACGGGGSSTDSGYSPSPPPAPRLSIDESNMGDLATAVFSVGETLMMLADEASLVVQLQDGTSIDAYPPRCISGSTSQTAFDNDQSGGLSAGDELTLHYDECRLDTMDGYTTGSVRIKLTSMDAERGGDTVHYIGTVNTDSLFVSHLNLSVVEVAATYEFEYARDIYQSVLAIRSSATGAPSGVELGNASPPDFEVVRTQDFETANYSLSMTGSLNADNVDGTARFRTLEPFTGFFNSYPTSGVLQVSGGDASKMLIRPNTDAPSQLAVELDKNGDGVPDGAIQTNNWEVYVIGHFWWYALAPPKLIATKLYDPNDFTILNWRPAQNTTTGLEKVGLNSPIRLQASRAINPLSVPAVLSLREHLTQWPYTDAGIDLDIEVRGAMILMYPTRQLVPGGAYGLDTDPFWISDMNGNQVSVTSFDLGVRPEELLVTQSSPFEAYAFPGDRLDLSASGSYSPEGSALAFEWSQEAGAEASLAGVTSETLSVIMPQVSTTSLLRFFVKATNEHGEYDYAKTDVTLFSSPDAIDLAVIRGRTTEGLTEEYLLTPANGSQEYSYNGSWGLQFKHETNDVYPATDSSNVRFGQNLSVSFGAPYTETFGVGDYENITPGGDGPRISINTSMSCSFGNAEFHVLEFETGANREVLKLALDYRKECYPGEGYEQITGYIRKNSQLPVPPASD